MTNTGEPARPTAFGPNEPFAAIQPGLKGQVHLTVAREHTAQHLGSGGVEVLATPQMVLLMERASVAAVDHLLPEGYRTVGASLDIRHLAPTPLGWTVSATAELAEIQGKRLTFKVEVHEQPPHDRQAAPLLVGDGVHGRAIIDVQRFGQRLAEKTT